MGGAAAPPAQPAEARGALTWLDGADMEGGWLGESPTDEVRGDSLALLEEIEQRWRAEGGVWMGWITYECGAAEVLGGPRERGGRLPGICMRRYERPRRLEGGGEGDALAGCDAGDGPSRWPLEALRPLESAEDFRAKVRRIKSFISGGDTYQVNLSQVFRASWSDGTAPETDLELGRLARHVFSDLRRRAPASMGALVETDAGWLISNSPERLISVRFGGDGDADIAVSSPIKGTRRRHRDPEADARARRDLATCPKERAEHVMIVDLVRNDLGRCARPGTVRADRTPRMVSLPTVHHLVTDVRCELRSGWSLGELVESVFPGGSVTGAPKRRTMEIIETLESGPREVYCGAIVALHDDGLDLSIPIRTGILDRTGMWLRSGGGIVADSDPERERIETETKTLAFDPSRQAPSTSDEKPV